MKRIFKRNRIAFSIMIMVTVLNIILMANMVAASDNTLAVALNGQNVYGLAIPEMLLVLVAYIVCKHQPLPTPY